ncbi:universal stress protein A-like protein [Andrographis paniculata]|uniref:universal stress protein A-like protein n=1 Tax=Andrographis paniculata TaxID=175694 RepID=UPI0021E8558F|nr:universal stress protein A-like protein [Andrographis paniculata]
MGKAVVVVGMDDSDISYHALEWTLQHLILSESASAFDNSTFKLVIVHARLNAVNAIGIAGATPDLVSGVDTYLEETASKVKEKARRICSAYMIHTEEIEVKEGDPRRVLCEAVEKHNASMLVVGSHGHGALKRIFLGSVSDYLVHHVKCTVIIVKQSEKIKRSGSTSSTPKASE